MNRLSAVILSAGYSSRMKDFKPLLNFGNKAAVRLIYDTYRECGIEDILIVTGFNSEKLMEENKDIKVKWVLNLDFKSGMYSSIKAAVKEIDENSQGFFLNPVDIPVIKKQTIADLKNEFEKGEKGIIYPIFNGKRGHPTVISTNYSNIITENSGTGGLKSLLQKYENDFAEIPVCDNGTVMDMDTPEDYRKLQAYFNLRDIPDEEEITAILNKYSVPMIIIKHQEAAADIAVHIGKKLKASGYYVDIDKIKAASLLHDIGRTGKNHAARGGEILRDLGYDDIADIVSVHMDIEVTEKTKITEKEIVYLSDKLVIEDMPVSLDKRFEKAFDKFKDNQEALNNIKIRLKNAVMIQNKINSILEGKL
ncbi:MAG: NTP transferase domain-containing protein [Bacillota bacterium]|nr:NTP transferase domain-containing protein [Bacillota bacterium]